MFGAMFQGQSGGGASAGGSAARAYLQNNLGLAAGVFTKAPLNLKVFDNLNEFDNVVNFKFIAQAAGIYHYIGTENIYGVTAGSYAAIDIRKNGTSILTFYNTTGVATTLSIQASDLVQMAVNDYLEIFGLCYNAGGGFLGGISFTFLDIMKV